jgi:hypothetical protein
MQGKASSSSTRWVGIFIIALEAMASNTVCRKLTFSSLGDRALAFSGGQAVSTIQSANASVAFDMIKEQVNHFAQNSKILVGVLDEVGKAHPFVQSVSSSPLCSLLSIGDPLPCSCCVCVQSSDYLGTHPTRERPQGHCIELYDV